jgi:hypothetical protein
MADDRNAVTLELASKLEVAISAAHSAGMSEPQLKPFIDMANEWKTAAGVSTPFVMQPSDAQVQADAAKALADKNAADVKAAADKKASDAQAMPQPSPDMPKADKDPQAKF